MLCERTFRCELALTDFLTGVKSLTLYVSLGFSPKVVIDFLHRGERGQGIPGALILNQVKKLRKTQPTKLRLIAESLQLVLTSSSLE